ncbi:uncharacterized protein LOC142180009 [Nicotiana tabacum]|uniref:Uncharacterized protein LOC142180009 n=1 Tax=Nicotiana tabacum TaxID=4097 RepID=A0AC58UBZ8_TOBAC
MRADHRFANRDLDSSSSRFRKDRGERNKYANTNARIGDYNFNVSTSELVTVLRNMGDKGYLTELFSEKGKQAYMKNRKEPPKLPSPKKTLNVINGGEEVNSVTYTTARKTTKFTITHGKRTRQTLEDGNITFDDADADGLMIPHNDTLIEEFISKEGRIASLGRFISRSSEKSIKFFSVLKKQNQFEWTEECRQALKDMKAYLTNPPLLSKPRDGERLFVYLAVAEVVVSAVLVSEDKGKQSHIDLEKLALALVMAARKLRPYFQCHHISVVTAYPLRNILHKQELSGRLTKGAIELSEYDIIYQPRTTIKSQILADFVAGFNTKIILEVEKELQFFTRANPGTWTLFTDGSSNVKEAGLGIVLIPPSGENIRQAIKCYPITNNEAEYEVVIAGLELARELFIEQIIIKSDSQLVVNQMQGTYTAREARMQQYLEKTRELVRQFQSWKIVQIPREENAEADALANLASVAEVTSEENAIVIHLFHSTLDQDKHEYGIVPEGKKESQVLRRKVARYCLIRDNLYRKIFGGPLTRCLGPNQTEYVMREVHEEHCGNHAGGISLVKTLIRAGYYRPKMEEDAEYFVAKCDKCQRYFNNMHRAAELLHTVISPWTFIKWGMDIVGPLPQAKEKSWVARYYLVMGCKIYP